MSFSVGFKNDNNSKAERSYRGKIEDAGNIPHSHYPTSNKNNLRFVKQYTDEDFIEPISVALEKATL